MNNYCIFDYYFAYKYKIEFYYFFIIFISQSKDEYKLR